MKSEIVPLTETVSRLKIVLMGGVIVAGAALPLTPELAFKVLQIHGSEAVLRGALTSPALVAFICAETAVPFGLLACFSLGRLRRVTDDDIGSLRLRSLPELLFGTSYALFMCWVWWCSFFVKIRFLENIPSRPALLCLSVLVYLLVSLIGFLHPAPNKTHPSIFPSALGCAMAFLFAYVDGIRMYWPLGRSALYALGLFLFPLDAVFSMPAGYLVGKSGALLFEVYSRAAGDSLRESHKL